MLMILMSGLMAGPAVSLSPGKECMPRERRKRKAANGVADGVTGHGCLVKLLHLSERGCFRPLPQPCQRLPELPGRNDGHAPDGGEIEKCLVTGYEGIRLDGDGAGHNRRIVRVAESNGRQTGGSDNLAFRAQQADVSGYHRLRQ